MDRHPSEMNMFQQYCHTVKLAKKTSRMKNPAWYQDALELDIQIHCYIKDNNGAECYLHVKSHNSYERIDGLTSRQLEQRDELEKFIHSTLENPVAANAKSLGIIFYLADEFSIASLGPEHQNPKAISDLREMMIEDPMQVLEDKTASAETHSWRLLPYPGAAAGNECATVVAVSRKRYETLKTLREIGDSINLPVKTSAVSAPLCAIGSLPFYANARERGTVAIFNYETFSLLAFFNKYFDLMMVRFMHHPNGSSMPSNIGPAVMATATAFELESPEIIVMSMVEHDLDIMIASLQISLMGSEIFVINQEEIVKGKGLPGELPIEVLVATEEMDASQHVLAGNETFRTFAEEKWHLQDFYSPDREELEMYPDAGDMKLLKMGKRIKFAAVTLLIGLVAYSGYSVLSKVQSDAWLYQKVNYNAKSATLTAEQRRYEKWDKLLRDRSKGWVSMELVARLLPDDGSVVLKDVKHNVNSGGAMRSKQNGFSKVWRINGYCSEKGVMQLEKYSTRDGIKKLFKSVASATGNTAYLPDVGQRDITVNFTQRPNPTYNTISPKNPGDMFRRAFNLRITQKFTGRDEMAIPAAN